ncbi:hypothetical protein LOK74_00135 [Brevibacillus humidisoli]|uniref:hypothetical protein n=1 Tax=Brevibacillus humidisoli TaxID=2895522 RepID=UPI001E624DE2|nr:hypothetical protein [Brevibacillus humidisoli]UFJ41011.1 hypothetical protein LOK74_00135 [Brevibacillus humidisoli]
MKGKHTVFYLIAAFVFSVFGLHGCGNTNANEELIGTFSDVYYKELDDLHIITQTLQMKLEAFQKDDPGTVHYLDEAIGAMEIWAKTKPHIFYSIDSLPQDNAEQVVHSELNQKVEQVYDTMLRSLTDVREKIFVPVSTALHKDGTLNAEQAGIIDNVQVYLKELNEVLYESFHDLPNQREYLYDTRIFNEDLMASLDNILSISNKIQQSIPD